MYTTDSEHIDKKNQLLRETIKKKYKQYHLLDKLAYPEIEYNTSRDNYEPLRKSFEHEFYEVQGISRRDNDLHIPSTNTLALLFTNDTYVPRRRILLTCQAYAESFVDTSDQNIVEIENPVITNQDTLKIGNPGRFFFKLMIGLCLVISLCTIIYFLGIKPHQKPSGLEIFEPVQGQQIPMEVRIRGRVSNAQTVWVVVKYVDGLRHWVQPPITVNEDGTWNGVVYVGENVSGDIGLRSQIRAFVNPVQNITYGQTLDSWPEAELSSPAVEVIRLPALNAHSFERPPSDLSIERPIDGTKVNRETLVEGKVNNAQTVWIVVRDINHNDYYVQPHINVASDGSWRGPIHIGGLNPSHNGVHAEVQAFVNPYQILREGEILSAWPKAELSSEPVEVIRGESK